MVSVPPPPSRLPPTVQQKHVCALVSASQRALSAQASWAEKRINNPVGSGTDRRQTRVSPRSLVSGGAWFPRHDRDNDIRGVRPSFQAEFSVINCGITSYGHNQGRRVHFQLSRRWQTRSSRENWSVPTVLWLTQLGGAWDTEMLQSK